MAENLSAETRVHDLKTWPEPFAAIRAGLKPWELRFDDRGFQVGDTLRLHEWHPTVEAYTGEVEERQVAWKLDGGRFGLPAGYVIMTLSRSPAPPVEGWVEALKEALEHIAKQPPDYDREGVPIEWAQETAKAALSALPAPLVSEP